MKPTHGRIDRVEIGIQQRRERLAGPHLRILADEDLATFCSETGKRFGPNVSEIWIWHIATRAHVVKVLAGLSARDLV